MTKQSLLCFSILALSSFLYGEDSTIREEIKQQKEIERKKREHAYIEKKITALENAYIPALRNGIDIWAHVDLLYFVPTVRSMAYTNEKKKIATTDSFVNHDRVTPEFEWNPGYQVGVGYLFRKTHWDLAFDATHYRSMSHGKRSDHGDPVEGMFPVWSLASDILPSDYVTEAKMKGKVVLNRLRLTAGYFFEAGRKVIMRTYVGIEDVSLKQSYSVTYEGGIFPSGEDNIHMKNNYWGMGPQFGVSPWFLIGKGWSAYVRGAATYLLGRFDVHQKEEYLDTNRFDEHRHLFRCRWASDLEGGIQWKVLFYRDRFSFSTRFAWEYLVYFDQNSFKRDDFGILQKGGVQFEGGILSVRVDF